jgi:hypothetical protein
LNAGTALIAAAVVAYGPYLASVGKATATFKLSFNKIAIYQII